MAIKVRKQGECRFYATCPLCHCEFEYEREDIDGIGLTVSCPECGRKVAHGLSRVCDGEDGSGYQFTPTVWTTPYISDIAYDCDKCPNKPDLSKPVVGDTPCTWCPKNTPYCCADLGVSTEK